MLMFQYSICDMYFGIMKVGLISEISVGSLLIRLLFFNSAKCQDRLFTN